MYGKPLSALEVLKIKVVPIAQIREFKLVITTSKRLILSWQKKLMAGIQLNLTLAAQKESLGYAHLVTDINQ
jgi:hypothetical protein